MASILHENMPRYLSADIIRSEKQTAFRDRSLRKTVSSKEWIMSKDKHPCLLLHQMEAICLRTSSVPRSKQLSESVAQRKL